jgi:hypothetical protein
MSGVNQYSNRDSLSTSSFCRVASTYGSNRSTVMRIDRRQESGLRTRSTGTGARYDARPEQEETRGEGVRASPTPIVRYSRAERHKQDKTRADSTRGTASLSNQGLRAHDHERDRRAPRRRHGKALLPPEIDGSDRERSEGRRRPRQDPVPDRSRFHVFRAVRASRLHVEAR